MTIEELTAEFDDGAVVRYELSNAINQLWIKTVSLGARVADVEERVAISSVEAHRAAQADELRVRLSRLEHNTSALRFKWLVTAALLLLTAALAVLR